MHLEPVYPWESLPEHLAAQEYSRCLGRILASLPRRHARKAARPLAIAAVRIAAGITGANVDLPPGYEMPVEERAMFRQESLEGLDYSRQALRRFHKRRIGDRAQIRSALELLDQIERWINAGPMKVEDVH